MNTSKPSVSPITWRTGILFALGAVICFHLAYLPTDFWPMRLFAFGYLTLLTQLVRLKTGRQSFYMGLGAGLLCVAPQLACFWNIFGLAAVPLWLIISLWTGAFVGLGRLVLIRFGMNWALALLPCLWTGLEYFRSELYHLKFSWMNVGYAFAGWQAFPIHTVGMYGAGFLAALIAAIILAQRWKFLAAVILIGSGIMLLSPAITFTKNPSTLNIAGIQMEFPAEHEIPAALDQLLKEHPTADLVVLSEYTLDGPVPKSLKDWCRRNQRYLIVGGKDPAANGNFYDTGFVVGPDGEIVFKQGKSVPIQFFKDGLPAPAQTLWNSPWGKIGICICYDLSYTRVTDRLVKLGAQLLVVPTMDVVDWGRREHELHALVAPVRAAEYGLPIFRLASSGISQAVDDHGRVVAEAAFPGDHATLFAKLRVGKAGTLPADRILAPASVTVTAGTIIALVGALCFRRKQPASTPTEPAPETVATSL